MTYFVIVLIKPDRKATGWPSCCKTVLNPLLNASICRIKCFEKSGIVKLDV